MRVEFVDIFFYQIRSHYEIFHCARRNLWIKIEFLLSNYQRNGVLVIRYTLEIFSVINDHMKRVVEFIENFKFVFH